MGISHNDLKLPNILYSANNNAILIDYDVSRIHKTVKTKQVTTLMKGYTSGYAAP